MSVVSCEVERWKKRSTSHLQNGSHLDLLQYSISFERRLSLISFCKLLWPHTFLCVSAQNSLWLSHSLS